MTSFLLKKEEFERWPFSVNKVTIKKEGAALFAIYKNVKYNLNGVAKGGWVLDHIWLDNPDIPGTKISISPILKKCREVFN